MIYKTGFPKKLGKVTESICAGSLLQNFQSASLQLYKQETPKHILFSYEFNKISKNNFLQIFSQRLLPYCELRMTSPLTLAGG